MKEEFTETGGKECSAEGTKYVKGRKKKVGVPETDSMGGKIKDVANNVCRGEIIKSLDLDLITWRL